MSIDPKKVAEDLAQRSRAASQKLVSLSPAQKTEILRGMAAELRRSAAEILKANQEDLAAAKKEGLSGALVERLELSEKRIEDMAVGLEQVALQPDPVSTVIREEKRPNGLLIRKVRVPLGVVMIVFESRPNVTADAAGLCIRSSNAALLRGGKEALRSNVAIAAALQRGGASRGLPEDAVLLVPDASREVVRELVQREQEIDLLVLRGGESLIRSIAEISTVPVVKHYKGVCHVFVDDSARLENALKIVENAKCQRPGVCNALETLLVHKAVARDFLPKLARQLTKVELRGDSASRAIAPEMKTATEEDWSAEYLDLILSVKVVDDVQAAIEHINHYGSHHSDSIVTESTEHARLFTEQVDSAAVYVNASTRFTDGGQFGMGAEIGISTDKLHSRGPMGVEELTTYKYVVHGSGQIRE